tara:strand:+ start:3142 stop:3327 length:186 start_codon:yes stop_codon:yes gene_type:complete
MIQRRETIKGSMNGTTGSQNRRSAGLRGIRRVGRKGLKWGTLVKSTIKMVTLKITLLVIYK